VNNQTYGTIYHYAPAIQHIYLQRKFRQYTPQNTIKVTHISTKHDVTPLKTVVLIFPAMTNSDLVHSLLVDKN
jgi:hypothetical protein